MDYYDSISDFLKELKHDVKDVCEDVMVPIVEDVMHDKAVDIYNEYGNHEPNRHQLKESGSYGDKEMIEVEVYESGSDIVIRGVNNAKGRGFADGQYLDSFIEEGNYDYWFKMEEGYPAPPPRPAIQRAEDYFDNSNEFDERIIENLKGNGYEFV